MAGKGYNYADDFDDDWYADEDEYYEEDEDADDPELAAAVQAAKKASAAVKPAQVCMHISHCMIGHDMQKAKRNRNPFIHTTVCHPVKSGHPASAGCKVSGQACADQSFTGWPTCCSSCKQLWRSHKQRQQQCRGGSG